MELTARRNAIVEFVNIAAPHELERIEAAIEAIKQGHKPSKSFEVLINIPNKELTAWTKLQLEGHGWTMKKEGGYTHPFCATDTNGTEREINIDDPELTALIATGYIRPLD